MPKISKRGTLVPASPIRKLVPFAEAAKNRGIRIFHLNIGQPDIETPAIALEAVKKADLKVLEYSHSAGFESYRRKLPGYYARYGIQLDPSQIIITTGASEAISFAMQTCLDTGDEIIIPEPFYANYNGFSIASGVKVVPVTSYIEQDFALPPIEDFEKQITPATRAIMICNPSNPTGYLYSLKELEKLKDIVLRHNLFLFVDEVYREFCYDGREFHSILNLKGLDEHVIVCDSISKRYSACGARVGFLISRNKEVMATALKFAQARLSPPTLAQILAEATLEVGEDFIKDAVAEYDSRRKLMVTRLKAMEGVVCPVPGGAFYNFVRLPIDDCDRFCQWLLEEFDYKGSTLMLAPGTGFYSSPGLGKQEVRVAYVLNKENISIAMDCLEAALKVYPGIAEGKTIRLQSHD